MIGAFWSFEIQSNFNQENNDTNMHMIAKRLINKVKKSYNFTNIHYEDYLRREL